MNFDGTQVVSICSGPLLALPKRGTFRTVDAIRATRSMEGIKMNAVGRFFRSELPSHTKPWAILAAACAMVAVGMTPNRAIAMGQSLPNVVKDEAIVNSQAFSNFSLRAQDGSVISILAETARKQGSLTAIPAERGADHRKCGGGDTDMIMKLIDVMMRTMQTASLTPSDRIYLQKVPRCEPYLSTLVSINGFLTAFANASPASAGDQLQRLSVVKASDGNFYISISTAASKLAMFKITSSLKGISNLRDLNRLAIPAGTSGQGLGLVFQIADVSSSDPTHNTRTESCDVTDTVYRPCDRGRDGKQDRDCGTIYISHPGHRQVEDTSSSTTYSLTMSITNAQNQALYAGTLQDIDDDSSSSPGICTRD